MISLDLQGRRALVTGGSGGLGRAIAETLATAGAQVAVHYRKGLDEAEAVAAATQKRGGKAQAFQADVADPAAVEKLLQEIESAFGGLDILVNNAGMDGPRANVGAEC
ncbi:MAG: SDR family NAD(P)-dependent oxidoreductase [Acidithiobacillus sp.]